MITSLQKAIVTLFGPVIEHTCENNADYVKCFRSYIYLYASALMIFALPLLVMSIYLLMVSILHLQSLSLSLQCAVVVALANVIIITACSIFIRIERSTGVLESHFLKRHTPKRKIILTKITTGNYF